MKIMSLLAGALAAGIGSFPVAFSNLGSRAYRGPTPSRRVRSNVAWCDQGNPQSNKDDGLPRGYSGAKLARKAIQKAVAVKHPRGLRLDGVTV